MTLRSFFLLGLTVCLCVLTGAGQQLRGYSVGRYEGQAFNTTRNATGKIVLELKTIDTGTGAVGAHFEASEGLTGSGDISGKIDAAGVLRLSGSVGEWKITLAAKVKADEIKANYKLTGAGTQTGNFAIKLTEDDIAPPDDEEAAMVEPPKTNNNTRMPVAPPMTPPRTGTQTNTQTGIKQKDDEPEKSGYPKPDFSEMTRWYDIQAYDYDVFKNQIIFMVKAKAESRPDSFKFEYLDADGVVVLSQQFFGLWHGDLLTKPEKFAVSTPTESQMAKVKTVRVVRIVQ